MWQPAVITVPPASEPVGVEVATAFLAGVAEDEAALLPLLIAAARGHVEAYTGLLLAEQTVELRAGRWDDLRHLPTAPLRNITSITYLDGSGAEQALDPAAYQLCGAGMTRGVRRAIGATWPALRSDVDDSIVVTATFGFDQGAVPTPVVHAILLLLGDLYAFREDTVAERSVTPAGVPNGVAALLANYRVY